MEALDKPFLRSLAPVTRPILIADSVFRGLALLGLLYNGWTYYQSIGVFLMLLKGAMYAGGIAADLAILQKQRWGTTVGFVVAAVGIWLVLGDASALFNVSFSGLRLPSLPGSMYAKAVIKTILRTAWLGLYVAALLSVYLENQRPAEQE